MLHKMIHGGKKKSQTSLDKNICTAILSFLFELKPQYEDLYSLFLGVVSL